MAGGRQLDRHALRVFLAELACLNSFQCLVGLADFFSTRFQISLRNHSAGRNIHKRRIADIIITVGKSNPRRVAYPAPTVDIFRSQRPHILILQYAQNLPQSNCAGTWRAHTANFIFTIRRTNRLTLDNLIVFQIRHADFAGIIHSTGNGTDNILRLHSLIKRRTAFFRQQAHRTRKFRIFQNRSCSQRFAVRQEVSGGLRITLQGVQILLDGFRHTRRNGKTLFCQSNRFLKQTCPR